MERPKSPYQEITTAENADIHGNLRQGSWEGLQTLKARAKLLELAGKEREAKLVASFCDDLIRTTGSIDGKHRDSTTQAVQGQKAPTIALGVPNAAQAPAKPVNL